MTIREFQSRFFHNGIWAAVVAFCLTTAIEPSLGQNTSDGARTTQQNQSALNALTRLQSLSPMEEYAEPSPGDPDLGEQQLLTPRNDYKAVSGAAGMSVNWTSNPRYLKGSTQGDVYMAGYGQAGWLPHLGNNFFLEGLVQANSFRYAKNPSLDFNSLTLNAGILKVFRELDDIALYLNYQYTVIGSRGFDDDLLSENYIVTGVRKTFQFSRAHALYLAAEADFSLGGQPSFAMAHQFEINMAYQVKLTRIVDATLFYQSQVLAFVDDGGRADLRNNLGLSFGVKPWDWLTIYSSTWLGWNASNQSEYNFFAANLGGGITASASF